MHPSPANHSGWLSSGGPLWFSQWESPVPRPATSSPSSGSASSAASSTLSPSTTSTPSCQRGRHDKASTTRSQAFPSPPLPPAMPGGRGEKLVLGRPIADQNVGFASPSFSHSSPSFVFCYKSCNFSSSLTSSYVGMNLGIWTVTAQCTGAAVDGKDWVFSSAWAFCILAAAAYPSPQCIGEENLVSKLIGPLLVFWEAICEKGGW